MSEPHQTDATDPADPTVTLPVIGNATAQDPGPGSGSAHGPGPALGPDSGSAHGLGPDSGSAHGPGLVSGFGPGPAPGSGSHPGPGSAPGSGSHLGSGSAPGPGSGSAPDSGSHPSSAPGPDSKPPPGQSTSDAAHHSLPTLDGADDHAPRFWSARRIPAGILALVILGGAGLLLYDVVAVRADHPAMRWRRTLAREFAERPLDSTAVLIGAAVAAALGLWLLVLAVTPGLRRLLPMRGPHADVRAGLDRGAATTVLRDRAMDVAGVRSVRVRMSRSKVAVRAVAHFRDLDDVREDLDATLADTIRDLGLGRPPALAVRVARPGRKG